MLKASKKHNWKERLLEVRKMNVGELLDHPLNPKIHPASQKEPLRALLDGVGKVDILRAYYSERNEGKLTLWDGHCRRELKGDEEWNVGIYDLNDAEADLLLATFDPVGWQAEQSRAKLEAIIRDVSTGSAELQQFLSEQSEKLGIIAPSVEFKEYDESIENEVKYHECPACHHKWPA